MCGVFLCCCCWYDSTTLLPESKKILQAIALSQRLVFLSLSDLCVFVYLFLFFAVVCEIYFWISLRALHNFNNDSFICVLSCWQIARENEFFFSKKIKFSFTAFFVCLNVNWNFSEWYKIELQTKLSRI